MRRVDVAPAGPVTLPNGIGRRWEGALMAATLLLLSFGLVTLYSASGFLAQRQQLPDWHYALRQAESAAIGLGILWLAARIPYRFWDAAAWPLLAGVAALLVLTVLPATETLAPEINGARRWLMLGGVSVQPSELAKIAVVVWTASAAVRKADQLSSLSRGLLPFLLAWGVLVVPVLLEPNLSTAALIALLGGLVVFAAGARLGHFVFLGLVALPFLWGPALGVVPRAARDGVPRPGGRSRGRRLPGAPVARGDRLRRPHRPGVWRGQAEVWASSPRPTTTSSSPWWARSGGCSG